MTVHRIHLAGPITGVPDGNRFAFDDAATLLRQMGHEVFNPHNIADAPEYRVALMQNLVWICERATVQVLLPGYTRSPGSRSQSETARALRLRQYVARGRGSALVFWECPLPGEQVHAHLLGRLGPVTKEEIPQ